MWSGERCKNEYFGSLVCDESVRKVCVLQCRGRIASLDQVKSPTNVSVAQRTETTSSFHRRAKLQDHGNDPTKTP